MSNLLSARDEIFKGVHRTLLRPLGYKVNGLISAKSNAGHSWGLVVTSQPWNTVDLVDFDIEVVAAHCDYNPYREHGVKSGLGPTGVSLLRLSLSRLINAKERWWSLRSEGDIAAVRTEVCSAVEHVGVPILSDVSTLEGVVKFYSQQGRSAGYQPRSWALHRLGQNEEATRITTLAIEDEPHELQKAKARDWHAKLVQM